MIHTQQSIPYKPGEWVYFLMDHSIMAGQVLEISISLRQVDNDPCQETTEWVIHANGTKYHVALNEIASQPETIMEKAFDKYEAFKECALANGQTDPYSHIKEVF